eukprot:NODE_506_length_1666_cov_80.774273_g420_i0.p1 GENE.NODE_506_length_1666_cov_80.774273_g420_i0~~NODE_506_length_1666_cov_80.774273_g420_i0.p1  ORF type:complete len:129 (-),score=14.18 NODE_506_length_1666_cov_80.774273_g420_i0:53-439(-)
MMFLLMLMQSPNLLPNFFFKGGLRKSSLTRNGLHQREHVISWVVQSLDSISEEAIEKSIIKHILEPPTSPAPTLFLISAPLTTSISKREGLCHILGCLNCRWCQSHRDLNLEDAESEERTSSESEELL